ncbi:MAG: Xaa-Pro peptidase family protein [Planctomycetota bacterium]
MNKYLDNLCRKFVELKSDAFLVTNTVNVQYLSGFTGEDSFLLVTPKTSFFITDSRFTEQAKEEIKNKNIRIIQHKDGLLKKIAEIISTDKGSKIKRLAFESSFMSVNFFRHLKKNLKKGIKLLPAQNTIESLRSIKTPEEIEKIRKSIKCAADAFNRIRNFIKPGVTEKEIANEIDYYMRKLGAEHCNFTPIIGIDERAALPHAPISSKKVSAQSLVLIDWGTCYNAYNSDLTRVLFMGNIPAKTKTLYQIVLEAQQRAIDISKPGEIIQNVDFAARNYIKQKGYGNYFGHSLGHGIGRMVHELPTINIKNKEILKPGVVFTVEPGIYLPGKLGIRIEDMILVTETGCEVLTNCVPKELSQMYLR